MTMGEKIRLHRTLLGMSQEDLGARIGVKKAAIHKYENGVVVNLKRSTIAKIAEVLNISPSYLLDFSDNGIEKAAVPESAPLSDSEKKILSMYFRLDGNDRIKAEAYVEGLLSADKYTPKKEKQA